jgi:hypothetical protein
MPTTTILEATISLLDTLDRLNRDIAVRQDDSSRAGPNSGRSQVNFFQSRKSVVKMLLTSARGLKSRIHGAVNLVRGSSNVCFGSQSYSILTCPLAARHLGVEESERAGENQQQSSQPPARKCGRQRDGQGHNSPDVDLFARILRCCRF